MENTYVRKSRLLLVLNQTKQTIKENKEIKVKNNILRKQPNFQHYVKKIEARAKNGFLRKAKTCN